MRTAAPRHTQAEEPAHGCEGNRIFRIFEERGIDPGLSHDVGRIDGVLGKLTRDAVQKEQSRLGLPADAWPTRELLARL